MINWLKNKWYFVSRLGVKEEMSISVEKKVILSNQLSLVFYVILISMNFYGMRDFSKMSMQNVYSLLSIHSLLLIPWSNLRGYTKYTGFIICVATTFFTYLFSTMPKLDAQINELPIYLFFFPRFIGLSYIVLPFVLIDTSKKWMLIISVLFALFCLFFLDSIFSLNGIVFSQVHINLDSYENINQIMVFPVLFILFGMIFTININSKYEQKILLLINELKVKNITLENHKNEINTQMETIQSAFNIIEQKNKNITDSIQYAKSIQASFLPTIENFKNIFPQSFILYKPRDIVSGDFYWTKEMNGFKILIAADCTGHGVPGAFVSILGSTLLNDLILGQGILKPNEILDALREKLKNAMKQSKDSKQKDGMDMSVCVFETQTYLMDFAGANQSLIVCRNEEMIEIKSDHQPVGVYVKEKPFTLFQIQMMENDHFYIFSDGFQSQFGHSTKEKMKAGRFKQQLVQVSKQNIEIQELSLDKYFKNWTGNEAQIDDILVIGVKV